MKPLVALLTATFLVYLSAPGQEIRKEDIVKHRINSITYIDSPGTDKRVEVYNDHGDIVRRAFTSDDEKTDANTEYIYNDSFQLTRSVHFRGGSHDHSSTYYYTNNRLSRVETTNTANNLTIMTVEYDKRGNKSKELYSGRLVQNYRTTRYTYNDQNLLIREVTTDNPSKKKTETVYTYNSKGQLVKTIREFTPTLIFNITEVYNDIGRLIERIDSVSTGDIFRFTYTYGQNGLLTAIDARGFVTEDGKKKAFSHKTKVVVSVGEARKNERMLFVVDSVPILKDPESWNPITKEDWADITVIRDKDSIRQLGWEDVDAITYIFTKGYRGRPDSLRVIPSLRELELIDGIWLLDNKPYTGKYIDYYNSGRIMDEGMLVDGKLNGALTVYYPGGQKKSLAHYKNGVLHGLRNDYYPNGAVMQSWEYWEGKASEAHKEYFINGRLQFERKPAMQTSFDTTIAYYSTGAIRKMTLFREGKLVYNKKAEDLRSYSNDFFRGLKDGDLKEANNAFYKIWKIDSASADTYFKAGLLMMKEFRFDEALAEFNKALSVEPLLVDAFVHRALARIKKYKFAALKPVPEKFKEPALVLGDLTAIPYDEQLKVCDDLHQARSQGFGGLYANTLVPGTILDHCNKKTSF